MTTTIAELMHAQLRLHARAYGVDKIPAPLEIPRPWQPAREPKRRKKPATAEQAFAVVSRAFGITPAGGSAPLRPDQEVARE